MASDAQRWAWHARRAEAAERLAAAERCFRRRRQEGIVVGARLLVLYCKVRLTGLFGQTRLECLLKSNIQVFPGVGKLVISMLKGTSFWEEAGCDLSLHDTEQKCSSLLSSHA